MRIDNEFEVAVPPDRVWETLLDIERVAGFLPGAVIEPADENGAYRGSMKLKLGPIAVNYEGSARLGAVNERERSARIEIEARDTRGQGSVSGVIHSRLVPTDGGTRVIAQTEIDVTGRQAQFGRGIMEDVAGRMMRQFAGRFEQSLLEPTAGPDVHRDVDDDSSLNVLSILMGVRAIRLAGVVAVALLVGLAVRKRRAGLTIRISRTW